MTNLIRCLPILLVATLFVSACGVSTPTAIQPTQQEEVQVPSPETPKETAAPPTETREVVIKFAVSASQGEANTLDPINLYGEESSDAVNLVYNQLIRIDNEMSPVIPDLAYKWESNQDKTEWTFYLHEGVKFHDGHELTCKDVVWTFKRLIDPKALGEDIESESATMLGFLNFDNGVTCGDDPYTVKFATEKPVPDLPALISIKSTWIIPEGATHEDIHLTGNGTGPFIPVDFIPVQQPHVFIRNPNYWEPGLPKADKIEMYLITEPTTRAAALVSGEVDLVQIIDFVSIPALAGNPNVEILETKAGVAMLAVMWVDTPPFDDIRVRTALKKVIDPQQVVDICWQGNGIPGGHNPIPPSYSAAYTHEVPKQDIEGATLLLQEAGFTESNKLKTDLYAAEVYPGFTCFAQMIAEGAAKTGLAEINVIKAPEGDYWSEVWLKQPFSLSAHNPRSPAEAIPLFFACASVYPESHWCDTEFDEVMYANINEPDDAKRAQNWMELQRRITEEGGEIFDGQMYTVAAIRKGCSGYDPHPQVTWFDLKNLYCEP